MLSPEQASQIKQQRSGSANSQPATKVMVGHFRRRWRVLVAVAVTTACVVVLLTNTNLEQLQQAASTANYQWLALAVAVSSLTLLAKGLRWRLLYPAWMRPTLGVAFSGVAVGQIANWAIPLRTGEALRVGLAGPGAGARGRTGRGLAVGIGVLAAEKLLDGLLLAATVGLLVRLVGVPGWLSTSALVLALVALPAGLLVAMRLRHAPRLGWLSAARSRLRKVLPVGIDRILEDATGVAEGFSTWLTLRLAGEALLWSAAAWVLGAGVNYLVMRSVGIDARQTLAATLAVLAALYGAAVIPTLPGRLGVFQYLCVAALAPFGVSLEQALVFSVALYVAVYLPPIVIGIGSVLVLLPWGRLPGKMK